MMYYANKKEIVNNNNDNNTWFWWLDAPKLANSEYLTRHNQALMVFAVAWTKQQELVGQEAIWYKQR